jgi:hypothetical protein
MRQAEAANKTVKRTDEAYPRDAGRGPFIYTVHATGRSAGTADGS